MPLTGSQLDRIHSTIIAAYTRDELTRAVRVCMNVSFDDYAPDEGFADQVSALIEWASLARRAKMVTLDHASSYECNKLEYTSYYTIPSQPSYDAWRP